MQRPDLFVPLSVNYVRDAAIRHAGERAEVLYIRALAYAKQYGNDGWIPEFDLPVIAVGLPEVEERVKALVHWNLWVEADEGWRIRSWKKWNEVDETRAEAAEKKRSDAAERKRRQRERERQAAEKPTVEVPAPAVGEPATASPDPSHVTRDVTRDGRDSHALEIEIEEEKEREHQPALRAGVTVTSEPSRDSATPPAPRRPKGEPEQPKPNPHAEADAIADAWWKRNKASTAQSFIAVRTIIRPIIAQGVDPQLLAAAMDAATRDGYPISQGTLTTAMNRLRRAEQVPQDPFGNVTPIRPSAATQKVTQAMAVAAKLRAERLAREAAETDPFAAEA